MKKLYVILINSETYFTKFLRVFTKCQYNHVVFTFDEDCKNMYTYARWITWMPVLAGFEIENINKGVLRKKPLSECRVYEIDITHKEYFHLRKKLRPFLTKPKIYHWYNFLALFCMQLNLPYYSETSFVCSTFVAYMLRDILGFEKTFLRIKPNDYLELELPLVFEGKLANYIEEKKKTV